MIQHYERNEELIQFSFVNDHFAALYVLTTTLDRFTPLKEMYIRSLEVNLGKECFGRGMTESGERRNGREEKGHTRDNVLDLAQ